MSRKPLYDLHPTQGKGAFRIKVATSLSDLMSVVAIRAAVFLSEQSCPFGEEFDDNDFCALHLIGYRNGEPAACIRARFFADFCKLERLAVRFEHRNTRLSFLMVKAGVELARKKGYCDIYGHAQERLVNFWSRFGAEPLPGRPDFTFSDFSYREMLIKTEPHPDPIRVGSDPYVIIRPEGYWHHPGVLEDSSERPVSSPLRKNPQAA